MIHLRSLRSYYTSSPFSLRKYQEEAIAAVHEAIARGVHRPAVVLATGGGKTIVFSHLVGNLIPSKPTRGNKVLVLAHKEELVQQAARTMSLVNPTLKVDIDMREFKPSQSSDIIVASVPTLLRSSRLEKYNPNDFKAIILDECHHATASSWAKILKYFQANAPETEIYVIGFTATMERNDSSQLGYVFDEIVFQRGLVDMIRFKELVDVKFYNIDVKLDLEKVKMYKSDYALSDLGEVMNNKNVNLHILSTYIELQKTLELKSTLVFCVDIEHCKEVCGLLQKRGVNAQYVTGNTSKTERQAIIRDFKNGLINVLCNVQVFTEGTDIPNIDSIFLARPTRSRVLLVQMIGRGLRLHPGKEICHVIDIADTAGIGMQSVASLFSFPPGHKFEGKTLQELAQEENEALLKQKEKKLAAKLEAETKKIKSKSNKIRSMFDYETIEDSIKVNLTSHEGFLAYEETAGAKFQILEMVKEEFRRARFDWVRLGFDVWGVPCNNDSFFTITRASSPEETTWTASFNMFTSSAQLRASRFKVKKYYEVDEIKSSPNLTEVLYEAEAQFVKTCDSVGWVRRSRDYKLTKKQTSLMYGIIKQKAQRHYDFTPELDQKLQDELSVMDQARFSSLLFAYKYSRNSYFFRWELQRIFGPDKSMAKAMEKKKKLEKEIEEIQRNMKHITLDDDLVSSFDSLTLIPQRKPHDDSPKKTPNITSTETLPKIHEQQIQENFEVPRLEWR